MFEGLGFFGVLIIALVVSIIGGLFVTVNQGTVAVVTMFGKYRRVLPPGLNVLDFNELTPVFSGN